jgi:hypothetical protein
MATGPRGPRGATLPTDVMSPTIMVGRTGVCDEGEDLNGTPARAAAQFGKLGGAVPARSALNWMTQCFSITMANP